MNAIRYLMRALGFHVHDWGMWEISGIWQFRRCKTCGKTKVGMF